MRHNEEFLPVQPQGIGNPSEQRQGRLALSGLEVGDMTGFDVDARGQFTLRQAVGLTLFFQHSSEFVVCIHGILIQQAALDLPSNLKQSSRRHLQIKLVEQCLAQLCVVKHSGEILYAVLLGQTWIAIEAILVGYVRDRPHDPGRG